MLFLFEIRENTHNTRYNANTCSIFLLIFNTVKKQKNFKRSTVYRKKVKKLTVIYLYYHPPILISFNNESY